MTNTVYENRDSHRTGAYGSVYRYTGKMEIVRKMHASEKDSAFFMQKTRKGAMAAVMLGGVGGVVHAQPAVNADLI